MGRWVLGMRRDADGLLSANASMEVTENACVDGNVL